MESDFEYLAADKDVAAAINSLVEVIISKYRRKILNDQIEEVEEFAENMSRGKLTAKEICERYDCSLSELKKYEKHGLIPVQKIKNGKRIFDFSTCEFFFCYVVDNINKQR